MHGEKSLAGPIDSLNLNTGDCIVYLPKMNERDCPVYRKTNKRSWLGRDLFANVHTGEIVTLSDVDYFIRVRVKTTVELPI